MLEQLAKYDAEPCFDCYGLVGASPDVSPHPGLLAERQNAGSYICLKCGLLWQLGRFGWSRLVKAREAGSARLS